MVPAQVVLHKTDAFPLDGMADGDARSVRAVGCPAKGIAEFGNAMAVYFLHREAEGAPLVSQRVEVEYFVRGAVGLLFVVIDQDDEVAQLVFGGTKRSF